MGILSILNFFNINNLNLYNSFRVTFFILFLTLIITIVNIFIIKEKKARNILISEIIVLSIASYCYIIFIKIIEKYKNNKIIPNNILYDIIKYRYIDWILTTPLLLLSLILFLNYLNNDKFEVKKYLIIITLNFCMLFAGYIGEINYINKYISLIIGFIFYLMLISYIWYNYIKDVSLEKYVFFIFSIIWALYGFSFLLNIKKKNIFYNSLDTVSKGFFALFINIFYSRYIY